MVTSIGAVGKVRNIGQQKNVNKYHIPAGKQPVMANKIIYDSLARRNVCVQEGICYAC